MAAPKCNSVASNHCDPDATGKTQARMKIACICATPSHSNPGMVSVDLAAQAFFGERLGLGTVQLEYFAKRAATITVPGYGVLSYSRLDDPGPQLDRFDAVVLWGDFLSAFGYLDRLAEMSDDRGNELDRLYRLFLMEKADDAFLHRLVILGGTLVTNHASCLTDRYVYALERLYSHAALVAPRDPVSTAAVANFTPSLTQGIDCAFFLDRDRRQGTMHEKSGPVGIYLGRGATQRAWYRWAVHRLARELSGALKARSIMELQWLEDTETGSSGPEVMLAAKLARIRNCSVVVTDTYHCAISALREGVPAICVGSGTSSFHGELTEKKKELLYWMLGIQDLYAFSERIIFRSQRRRFVDQAAAVIREGVAFTAMTRYVDHAMSRLDERVGSVLRARKSSLRQHACG